MGLKYIKILVICAILAVSSGFAFEVGKITANTPPEFDPVGTQTIMEGDILNLVVTATDADEDPITIGVSSRPSSSTFSDHGDGTATLEWQPDFTGPNSSEGSPFNIIFWASDGAASTQINVEIVVLNKNRKPQIEADNILDFTAGELVAFGVSGYDPDEDPITWEIITMPEGMTYDPDAAQQFSWQTVYADSGSYDVRLALSDTYGAADTSNIDLVILPETIYGLTIDTVSGYPGELVNLEILLENLEDIGGFNVLFSYDITALLLSSISEAGTRAENFEYFTYTLDYNNIKGDVKIIGVADLDNGTDTDILSSGEGPIIDLTFYITNDLSFSGYSIPIQFAYRDQIYHLDNTLTDGIGEVIEQSAIVHTDGYIQVKQVDLKSLGDINVNGVPYEIADAIYFTNYFMDPGKYPLSSQQRANSDVNQDGLTASIADLVYLINKLVNPGYVYRLSPSFELPVEVASMVSTGNFSLSYDSEVEIGGLTVTLNSLELADNIDNLFSEMADYGLTVRTSLSGNLIRLLIFGEQGQVMPSGYHEFLSISTNNNFEIEDIQFSTKYGSMMRVSVDESSMPRSFQLHQNYPNPFNPQTEISFNLPYNGEIKLSVFNILGQEVKLLVDGRLEAGHHAVVWDGRDNSGTSVSSGIYFYRLKAGEFMARKKMILLK
jgi:hypothetical protein